MEDNLTSADPLSYTTNRSRVDLELRGKRLLPLNVRIINIDRQTGIEPAFEEWIPGKTSENHTSDNHQFKLVIV